MAGSEYGSVLLVAKPEKFSKAWPSLKSGPDQLKVEACSTYRG